MRSSHFRAAAKVQRAALRALVVVVLGCEMQSEGSFSKHSIYPLRRGRALVRCHAGTTIRPSRSLLFEFTLSDTRLCARGSCFAVCGSVQYIFSVYVRVCVCVWSIFEMIKRYLAVCTCVCVSGVAS